MTYDRVPVAGHTFEGVWERNWWVTGTFLAYDPRTERALLEVQPPAEVPAAPVRRYEVPRALLTWRGGKRWTTVGR